MLELHGWLTIRETYKVSFDEEDHLENDQEEKIMYGTNDIALREFDNIEA